MPRLSIGVEYRSDSGLGELIRMRLAYKGSNETISSDILETVFYSWSETWYEPGMNTVPTHIHAVMISFHFTPTQASVKDFLPAQGYPQNPFISCNWDPMVRALACFPELQRIILFFKTNLPYEDLLLFTEGFEDHFTHLRDNISVELVHHRDDGYWTAIDFDTLESGTLNESCRCCYCLADGLVSTGRTSVGLQ